MKTWYTIKAQAGTQDDADDYDIAIHGEIGAWGIMARDFIREFSAIPPAAKIELSIHSPGGDVFEALAIYHTLLSAAPRITCRIEGYAASAASLIAMAPARLEMPQNAYLMLHNPAAAACGGSEDLREMAELLDKITHSLVDIYARKSGKSADEILALMDAETWFTGAEAVEAGFADAVLDPMTVTASITPTGKFKAIPQALAANVAPTEDTPPEPKPAPPAVMSADAVVTACLEAGFPDLAAPLIRAAAAEDTVVSRLSDAAEIKALAAAAGCDAEAAPLIAANADVETARTHFAALREARMTATVSNSHAADSAASAPEEKSKNRFCNIYAARAAYTFNR